MPNEDEDTVTVSITLLEEAREVSRRQYENLRSYLTYSRSTANSTGDRNKMRLIGCVLLIAVLAASCGGDDGSSSSGSNEVRPLSSPLQAENELRTTVRELDYALGGLESASNDLGRFYGSDYGMPDGYDVGLYSGSPDVRLPPMSQIYAVVDAAGLVLDAQGKIVDAMRWAEDAGLNQGPVSIHPVLDEIEPAVDAMIDLQADIADWMSEDDAAPRLRGILDRIVAPFIGRPVEGWREEDRRELNLLMQTVAVLQGEQVLEGAPSVLTEYSLATLFMPSLTIAAFGYVFRNDYEGYRYLNEFGDWNDLW